MRLASMTKRGDRLSRTRRKLRAVGLASVVGVERSYSAKRASIIVRMLLGEWLHIALLFWRNWSTYLMRLSWTMTFHIRRFDSNWRGAKANWKSGLIFLNEVSEHRAERYVTYSWERNSLVRGVKWVDMNPVPYIERTYLAAFWLTCTLSSVLTCYVNRWASHLATGFWPLCSSAPARFLSPTSSHRSPCSSLLPRAMIWHGQSLVPPIHQAKEHSTIGRRMDWKEMMMDKEWRLVWTCLWNE